MRLAPQPLKDMLEKEWDSQLFNSQRGLAPSLGWKLCYHTLRSKGSQPGFPDRVLVRDRIIYAELKREGQKPTENQVAWLDALASAGGEVYVWRPSDLDEIGLILSRRMRYGSASMSATASDTNSHPPASLWIPGIGRADTKGVA